jgi:single-stranded-DNA-specific exonuclease
MPEPIVVSEKLFISAGESSFLAELLFRRGITDPKIARAFLDPDIYTPAPPEELPDLTKSVQIIQYAIQNRQRIGVWGDFDVDGQTATTILVSALRDLGADVLYHIPVRGKESHGISIPYLKDFLNQEVKLLITCDTGISATEAAEFAHSADVQMIITDHHLLPEKLPKADAIINPKRLPNDHPISTLSGAGVAYELASTLLSQSSNSKKISSIKDLVVMGLIADQAILISDTRYLVQEGIKELRRSERLAIKEMLKILEINQMNISEEHIGFYLAPRLNALGRLADANPAVEFLLSEDPNFTREFAHKLEELNQERKMLSDQVFQAVNAQVTTSREIQDAPLIILKHPAWPNGVVGIVASQLVEIYNKPVILLSTNESGLAQGSARSIEGIDITQAIASQKEHLISFGGHAMAAGMAIKIDELPSFEKGIGRFVAEKQKGKPVEKILTIDSFLQLTDINLELVNTIEKLSPFGVGNPNPILVSKSLVVKSNQLIGKLKEHRLIEIEDQSGKTQKVFWWKSGEASIPEGLFDLALTLRSSNYQGQISPQVEWIEAHPAEVRPITLQPKLKFQVEDHRNASDSISIIQGLFSKGPNEIYWAGRKDPRIDLPQYEPGQPKKGLILATIPPTRGELLRIVEQNMPETIFLFGILPSPPDQMQPFLEYLGGLIKFVIREKNGVVKLNQFEFLTGQTSTTVVAGLKWLAAHGDIGLSFIENEEIKLKSPGIWDPVKLEKVERELIGLLNETRAFRSYYLRADPGSLLQNT